MSERKLSLSDRSNDEWAFVASDLTLLGEDAEQREHSRRLLLRLAAEREELPTAAICDSRTLPSSPESGARAGCDARAGCGGAKPQRGSKVHLAVDTLGHLLALHVTPADEQDVHTRRILSAQSL